MKKFTTAEIRDLFNQVMHEEISFSRMVEVINERMEEPMFKEGDFIKDVCSGAICIYYGTIDNGDMVSHVGYNNGYTTTKTGTGWGYTKDFRHATEEEKQILLDALAKEGKMWNAEKLCVEDIPQPKFKKGDKVRIKDGVSSKTHNNIGPAFMKDMDDLIGKTMTVYRYTDVKNYVECDGIKWVFSEDWLEPYVEELKKGDLAIFWDVNKKYAIIRAYKQFRMGAYLPHQDNMERWWINAIKFESKEQYNKLLKEEI